MQVMAVKEVVAFVMYCFHALCSVEGMRWHQTLVAFGPTEVLEMHWGPCGWVSQSSEPQVSWEG